MNSRVWRAVLSCPRSDQAKSIHARKVGSVAQRAIQVHLPDLGISDGRRDVGGRCCERTNSSTRPGGCSPWPWHKGEHCRTRGCQKLPKRNQPGRTPAKAMARRMRAFSAIQVKCSSGAGCSRRIKRGHYRGENRTAVSRRAIISADRREVRCDRGWCAGRCVCHAGAAV
jgi:hypothetical protein